MDPTTDVLLLGAYIHAIRHPQCVRFHSSQYKKRTERVDRSRLRHRIWESRRLACLQQAQEKFDLLLKQRYHKLVESTTTTTTDKSTTIIS